VSSGTRIVLGCLLFATIVFAVLSIYGKGSLGRRDPDSPDAAARRMVQADNTVVGLVGGISSFEQLELEKWSANGVSTARLEARVVGARDSGRLIAELSQRQGAWAVRQATFTLSNGTTIPVTGSAGR
jgi:hypothetical protein